MRVPFPRKKGAPPAAEETQPAPATEPSPAGEQTAGETPSLEPAPTSLDGLRAWVAQLDRKLSTRFYALGAATVLALAAGIVGIVLALGVKDDSATKAELDRLRDQVAEVERSASAAAEEEAAALGDRVSQLESQLQELRSDQSTTDQEISVLQDDIEDLRTDISSLDSGGNDNP